MPEESAHYLEQVEEFFVGTVRHGLMLRSSDVEVARDWQARDVPIDVVRKGILEGIGAFLQSADPDQEVPSVLKYYRTWVEKAFEAHRRAVDRGLTFRGSGSSEGPGLDLVAKAAELLKECAEGTNDESSNAVFLDALSSIETVVDELGIAVGLDHLDRVVAEGLVEAAPDEVSDRIRDEIDARLKDARIRGLGRYAMDDARHVATMEAVSREFSFPGLVATVVASAVEQD